MTFVQTDFDVTSSVNKLRATRFTPDNQPITKRILSLHGAGTAVRQRTFYLADMITRNGGEFVCFDFSGHGESSGTLNDSSLKQRVEEALAVVEASFDAPPDVVMGNSTGGYITVELLPYITPEAILLFCPAMYDRRAFDIPFTSEFTSILRKPGSYYENKAAAYLKAYKGRVLLAIGEKDDVIPAEVMDIYKEAASNASELCDFVVPDAPHVLHVWAAANSVQGADFLQKIENFIFSQ